LTYEVFFVMRSGPAKEAEATMNEDSSHAWTTGLGKKHPFSNAADPSKPLPRQQPEYGSFMNTPPRVGGQP
jgi:hypothetical protein